jgi:hypothetical protein
MSHLKEYSTDDLKEKGGYWKLKNESIDRASWRTCFQIGNGSLVRQTKERMNGTFTLENLQRAKN